MICNSEIAKVRGSLIKSLFVINHLKNDNLRIILQEWLDPIIHKLLDEMVELDRMIE